MNWVYVFIGGGIGSLARFGISKIVFQFSQSQFPIATLLSNVISCAVLGVFAYQFQDKISENSLLKLLIVTGFCGGFSTFSTFSLETVQLMRNGNLTFAIINVTISLITCVGLIYLFSKK